MKKFTTHASLKPSIQKIISYASLISCVAFFYFSESKSFAANKFSEENLEEITQIEAYLNNIKNLSAKFIQESDGGSLVEGNFFLSRPGKMRIEYSAQPKILIIVNGSILSYHDVELDETSRLSTNTTPASFLTRANISFDAKDVEITSVKKSVDQIKISVMKKNRKEAGEFSLVFARNPLKFLKMEVKNDLGQIVTVTLSNIDFTTPISDKIFVIRNDDTL